jgi:hypothetical protein
MSRIDTLTDADVERMEAEIKWLRAENKELYDHNARLRALLTEVANAFKGPPPALGEWSWSDLPRLAAEAANRD